MSRIKQTGVCVCVCVCVNMCVLCSPGGVAVGRVSFMPPVAVDHGKFGDATCDERGGKGCMIWRQQREREEMAPVGSPLTCIVD